MPKNQHVQWKFWYQLLWTTYDFQLLTKIRVFKIDCLVLTIFLVPNLSSVAQIFGSKINKFEQKKSEKNKQNSKNFSLSISNISHGKSRYSTFSTPTTENHKCLKLVDIKISFEHVDSWAKSLLFRTHHLWNSTTELTLLSKTRVWGLYIFGNVLPNEKKIT